MRERIDDYLFYIKFKVLQIVYKFHIIKFWRYIEVNERKLHGKVNRLPLYRFTTVENAYKAKVYRN